MANKSLYIDALLTFDQPASVREVYEKAVEMFGPKVKGDRGSARLCLERYLGTGKVIKHGTKYYATVEAADPIMHLTTKVKMLEGQNEKLRDRIKDLELELKEVRNNWRA